MAVIHQTRLATICTGMFLTFNIWNKYIIILTEKLSLLKNVMVTPKVLSLTKKIEPLGTPMYSVYACCIMVASCTLKSHVSISYM